MLRRYLKEQLLLVTEKIKVAESSGNVEAYLKEFADLSFLCSELGDDLGANIHYGVTLKNRNFFTLGYERMTKELRDKIIALAAIYYNLDLPTLLTYPKMPSTKDVTNEEISSFVNHITNSEIITDNNITFISPRGYERILPTNFGYAIYYDGMNRTRHMAIERCYTARELVGITKEAINLSPIASDNAYTSNTINVMRYYYEFKALDAIAKTYGEDVAQSFSRVILEELTSQAKDVLPAISRTMSADGKIANFMSSKDAAQTFDFIDRIVGHSLALHHNPFIFKPDNVCEHDEYAFTSYLDDAIVDSEKLASSKEKVLTFKS